MTNLKTKIGRLNSKNNTIKVDIGISMKPIFTNNCIICKNKSFLWGDAPCRNCTDNQVFPGTLRKFKKIYPDYHGKKR